MSSDSAKVVLYVVNDLVYFRAHRQALASAVAERGYRVFVIAGNCTQQDARESDLYTLVAVDIVRQSFSPTADWKFAAFVRRWVKKNRPGIVHMITIKPVLFATLGLVLPWPLHDFRLIWTLPGLGKVYEPGTGIGHRLRRWLTTAGLTFAARRAQATISVENAYDRERLIGKNIALPDRVEVVDGTGLDFEHFSATSRSKESPLTFLMATRLLNAKGVGAYIGAARQLREQGLSARFLLAGLTDPSNPDAYDVKLIEKAAEEGVIEWRGAVSQSAMPALFNEADIFCLPTQLQEGLPRSLMEAAACGCALVAPDQVPIRRILVDGETGWLLNGVAQDDLAQSFQSAIRNPDEVRIRGTKAATHICSLPVSDTDVLQKFLRLYGLEEAAD